MARQALGRGLEALLAGTRPGADAPAPGGAAVGIHVPVAAIRPNSAQPRRAFDPEALAELTESIRRFGVLQPLVVRRRDDGYELLAGERRLRAATAAGLSTVPVIVRESEPEERLAVALVENLQRRDLTPLEEAAAYRRLIDEFGLTQEDVAERVGKSRSAVANALRLLGLPEPVRAMIDAGVLSAGHARAVLAVGDSADEQIRFARELVEGQVPKAAAERLVQARRPAARRGKKRAGAARPADPNVRAVAERLTGALGTRVRLQSRQKGGVIEIEYYSDAELDRLVQRLLGAQEAL